MRPFFSPHHFKTSFIMYHRPPPCHLFMIMHDRSVVVGAALVGLWFFLAVVLSGLELSLACPSHGWPRRAPPPGPTPPHTRPWPFPPFTPALPAWCSLTPCQRCPAALMARSPSRWSHRDGTAGDLLLPHENVGCQDDWEARSGWPASTPFLATS
jgi:hypothetical protein